MLCHLRLRANHIYCGKERVRRRYLPDVWAHLLREFRQYSYYLLSFCRFQFSYAVVSLHHLGRLYEHRLSRCRLVVYYTLNFSLHSGRYRYHQSSVAKGRGDVLLHQSFALCSTKNVPQRSRHAALRPCQFLAYSCQLWRCVVAYPSKLIQYLSYASYQVRERHYVFRYSSQRTKVQLLLVTYEHHYVVYRCQRPLKVVQLALLKVRALYAQSCHSLPHVEEKLHRHALSRPL